MKLQPVSDKEAQKMSWRERFKCLLKNLKYIKQERGAVFVLTAILLPVLFGCLGIGYDVGNVYMHKARLQNATDAAALAAGEVFKNPPADDPQYTDLLKGKQIQLLNNHQAADRVAGEYIQKNEVNLGNPITIVERSALGYKDPSTQSGNTTTAKTTIFYRVIATEEVPLHFLPVILGMQNSPQKVKATSVARIETTTNTTQTGGGGTPTPVPNPSVFDNLFTYSEYFDAGLTNENNNINSTFLGNMVFTYGNGSSTQEHFYDMGQILAHNPQVADHLFNDSHANPNAIIHGGGTAHWNYVNDPIIDTFYNTTAYVDAFKKKLKGPHVDVTDQNVTITGDGTVNNGCIVNGPDNTKFWLLGEYYPLDNNENRLTLTHENQTYYICYHELIVNYNSLGYLRVAQNAKDGSLFLINDGNQFTGYYIGTKEVNKRCVETIFNASGTEDVNGYTQLNIKRYNPWDFNFTTTTGTNKSNIYHICSKISGSNNTVIKINDLPVDEQDPSKPLYIIVDSSMNGVIQVKIRNNERPVILVYLGISNITLEPEWKTTDVTNLTIYAPYGSVGYSPDYEPIHLQGTFKGNIIAKRIGIQAAGYSADWQQKNFLQNDEDVAEATRAMLEAVAAQTVPDEVKQAVKARYAAALNINVSDMEAENFYNKLGYYQKQALYAEWKKLITEEPYSNYKNMLWPWNSHFDLIIGDDGQPTTTVDSKSVIRIINPHLEDNPYFSSDSKI